MDNNKITMGNKIGQIEINQFRPAKAGLKKFQKKSRHKKMRKWIKANLDFVPLYNRFTGYE